MAVSKELILFVGEIEHTRKVKNWLFAKLNPHQNLSTQGISTQMTLAKLLHCLELEQKYGKSSLTPSKL